ncbi:ABC transporter permease subunit [Martelella sp. HB161492]|uniref:ABC transporter permease n=1 Tax=Martelella sp. HB161492 TaxID=2720726 RepID=UPI001591B660|nr:ABC transporter permease subunit [Martelella sp. HB161492]
MTDTKVAKITRYAARPLPGPPSIARRMTRELLPPVLMGIVIIIAYHALRSTLPEHRLFLMPDSHGMWDQVLTKPDFLTELFTRSLTTISIALAGLLISIPLGIVLAIVMFRFYVMEKAVFPYLVALQSIPVMAIIPLIQSAIGFGFFPKVLIVALFTFFAIPTTLLLGLKSVDRNIINLFKLQNASWWVMLKKAGLPSSAPTLFAGLRISGSLAVIAAIVSELFFLSGRGGLGQLLMNAKIDFKYEQMYAALIMSSALSIAVYLMFNWLGNRLFSNWHESGGKPQ